MSSLVCQTSLSLLRKMFPGYDFRICPNLCSRNVSQFNLSVLQQYWQGLDIPIASCGPTIKIPRIQIRRVRRPRHWVISSNPPPEFRVRNMAELHPGDTTFLDEGPKEYSLIDFLNLHLKIVRPPTLLQVILPWFTLNRS